MATWREMYKDSLMAAQALVRGKLWRNAVSRAYYTAYYAATAQLIEGRSGMSFPSGYSNPKHKTLPLLVENYFDSSRFTLKRRREISKSIETLRLARCAADYDPAANVGATEATQALQRARFVIRRIGYEL